MAKRPKKSATKRPIETIVQTLNVNTPGRTYPRNAAKYAAARAALLKVLPKTGPGLTQAEMMAVMRKTLPASQFGSASGWWTKTVQLDAEARGEVVRDGGKPLRWKRVG